MWWWASHHCHFLSAVYFPARPPVRLSSHPLKALYPPDGIGSDPTNPRSSASPLQHSSQSQPLKLWHSVFTQPEHTPCNMLFHFLFIPCIFLASDRMVVHSTAQLTWLHKDCITLKFFWVACLPKLIPAFKKKMLRPLFLLSPHYNTSLFQAMWTNSGMGIDRKSLSLSVTLDGVLQRISDLQVSEEWGRRYGQRTIKDGEK